MAARYARFTRCSFCDTLAKALPASSTLIVSDHVAICAECVDICVEILIAERARRVAKAGEARSVGGETDTLSDAEHQESAPDFSSGGE